ncbi:unnamed protein product [Ceutorhynchus assimilis]|uniref:DUF8207 domain-containing protein n=1 Tax=Ceutorhynchus assimilis TaxID=467358 RepID=A0A9N9QMI0_9CUCU|nr:unnamed protein product [Ceutorhynchus assimilis]
MASVPSENDRNIKKKILNAARSIRKKYLALKLERKEEDEALDRIINPITEPLREFVEKTVGRKVQVKHEKVKLEAPKTYFESEPKLPRNVEFQPAEIIAQTSENLISDDDDDDDDGAEDVFYEPLQHLKEDLQKSIHDRSGAYEEFLDQYPKVAQEYVDRYYKQSDEIDHSYGLKHDMKTDDWSMGSQKVNFLPNGDIKVGAVSYKGTQGLYDLLFLKKPIYQTEDDKLQFTDILNRTNVHRRDFDPSKQVKGSTSSKYRQFVKPLVSSSSEAKRLKSTAKKAAEEKKAKPAEKKAKPAAAAAKIKTPSKAKKSNKARPTKKPKAPKPKTAKAPAAAPAKAKKTAEDEIFSWKLFNFFKNSEFSQSPDMVIGACLMFANSVRRMLIPSLNCFDSRSTRVFTIFKVRFCDFPAIIEATAAKKAAEEKKAKPAEKKAKPAAAAAKIKTPSKAKKSNKARPTKKPKAPKPKTAKAPAAAPAKAKKTASPKKKK